MGGTIASKPDEIDPNASQPALRVRAVTSLDEVDRAAWEGLAHGPSPFLRWGFLRALERSGSIGRGTGWNPFYLLAETEAGGRLVGATAAFVKSHSYGEYIFDWSWASASERAGVAYYPKLVLAAPMTPATGRRFLVASGHEERHVVAALMAAAKQLADQAHCSSIHVLFCTAAERDLLAALGFSPRASYQFHWHNRGYGSYDDFLAQLTSRKRKSLKKERRRALEHLDELVFVPGGELDARELGVLDGFYRNTTWEHGGMDYLRPGFFEALAAELPEHMLFAQARRGAEIIAGALYLEGPGGLYGRYWGAGESLELLHFEVAYYAGIERCIAKGVPLFEAGAQGEHKLLRGFLPSPTYSAHWIRHEGLAEAIAGFLVSEAAQVEARMAELTEYGPYRHDDGS